MNAQQHCFITLLLDFCRIFCINMKTYFYLLVIQFDELTGKIVYVSLFSPQPYQLISQEVYCITVIEDLILQTTYISSTYQITFLSVSTAADCKRDDDLWKALTLVHSTSVHVGFPVTADPKTLPLHNPCDESREKNLSLKAPLVGTQSVRNVPSTCS